MASLLSFGAYVPPTRLGLSQLAGRPARDGGPEKAVAWADEDSITLAVTAGAACLAGFDRQSVDAVFFATTTQPFQEKQGAALVARALDLPRSARSVDLAGSLRAGLGALRAAADAVAAGSAKRALVLVADCRLGAPGSPQERSFGDAAAAFLVGGEAGIATLGRSAGVSDEIVDVWRPAGDPFVHAWEERFVVQEGYVPRSVEAVRALLEQAGAGIGDFARVLLYAPDARSHATVARALGVEAERLQDPLLASVGNAGCAATPLQLVAALEAAGPGDRLLALAYGDGAEALELRVDPGIEALGPRRGLAWSQGRRRTVSSYAAYQKARGLGTAEYPAAADQGLSATIHHRERDEDVSLKGQQCQACGAIQFPVQRVCESCFAKDRFELVRLSDRSGKVVTYTLDFFFPTPEPPTIVTITDVDGARVHLQLVDCRPEDVHPGLPVEFVFRRIHAVGGRPNYYWKAVPQPTGEPGRAAEDAA